MGKKLGARLSGVISGERERKSGHQVAEFIPHIVGWSTVVRSEWPEVCRLMTLIDMDT